MQDMQDMHSNAGLAEDIFVDNYRKSRLLA